MAEIKHFDDLYPNRFLKAGNLGDKPVTVTIAAVSHDNLEGDKGVEQKVILSFERTPKQLVLCKLNAHCIKAMFGAKVAEWIGKRVTLYATDQIMPMATKKADDRYCVRVYGSPDIAADFSFEWRPPKRKALVLTMRAVKGSGTAPQSPATAPASPAPQQPPSGGSDAPAGQDGASAPVCGQCGKASAEGPLDADGRCFNCATGGVA